MAKLITSKIGHRRANPKTCTQELRNVRINLLIIDDLEDYEVEDTNSSVSN